MSIHEDCGIEIEGLQMALRRVQDELDAALSKLDEQQKILDALEQCNGANIERCADLQSRLDQVRYLLTANSWWIDGYETAEVKAEAWKHALELLGAESSRGCAGGSAAECAGESSGPHAPEASDASASHSSSFVVERQVSNYTPGPWHWDSDPVKGDPLNRLRYRVCALGRTITQCYYKSDETGQAQADAQLIASAPSLVDALRAILGWRELRSGADEFPIERIEAIARDAIAYVSLGEGKH
jgi:hypothetical protein